MLSLYVSGPAHTAIAVNAERPAAYNATGHQVPAHATRAVATNGAGPPASREPNSRAKAKPAKRRCGGNSSAKYDACGPNIAAVTTARAMMKANAIHNHVLVPTSRKKGKAKTTPASAPNI